MQCEAKIEAESPRGVAAAMDALSRWAEGWAAEGVESATVTAAGDGYSYTAILSPGPIEEAPTVEPGKQRLPRPGDVETS